MFLIVIYYSQTIHTYHSKKLQIVMHIIFKIFFLFFREEGRTLGAYLVIEKVTKNDYGEYVCRISKPDKSIEMLVTISEKGK